MTIIFGSIIWPVKQIVSERPCPSSVSALVVARSPPDGTFSPLLNLHSRRSSAYMFLVQMRHPVATARRRRCGRSSRRAWWEWRSLSPSSRPSGRLWPRTTCSSTQTGIIILAERRVPSLFPASSTPTGARWEQQSPRNLCLELTMKYICAWRWISCPARTWNVPRATWRHGSSLGLYGLCHLDIHALGNIGDSRDSMIPVFWLTAWQADTSEDVSTAVTGAYSCSRLSIATLLAQRVLTGADTRLIG